MITIYSIISVFDKNAHPSWDFLTAYTHCNINIETKENKNENEIVNNKWKIKYKT